MGKALGGGSGWVLLTWSPRDRKLVNQWASDHCHTLAGATPILALDMYEHSYHIDFGAKAAELRRNLHGGDPLGKCGAPVQRQLEGDAGALSRATSPTRRRTSCVLSIACRDRRNCARHDRRFAPKPSTGTRSMPRSAARRAVSGDVHRYGFPRTDLTVTLDGVTIKPALALGGWLRSSRRMAARW